MLRWGWLAALTFSSCAAAHVGGPVETGSDTKLALSEIDDPIIIDDLETLMRKHDVPGLQMVAIADCKPAGHLELGLADRETMTPVGRETLFEAASLSKTVLAQIVMSLVDDGVIDLDRPLVADGFDYPRIADKSSYAQITPRLLLTHRSGLPNWAGDALDVERDDLLAFEAPVGTYVYSGEGIQLLQTYMEWKTGRSLVDHFRASFGDRMPHSQWTGPIADGTPISRGYMDGQSRDLMLAGGSGLAAASLLTTAEDFARFVSVVCTGEGLGPDTHEEMLRVQGDWYEDIGIPTARLIGWSVVRVNDTEMVAHTGNNGHYRAIALFERESRDGVVMLANGAGGTQLFLDFLTPKADRAVGDAN